MKYEHMLWCHEGTHDKIWGIILLQEDQPSNIWTTRNKYVTVWGRRGKKLQTKLWEGSDWEAKEMARKKQDKGYEPVRNRLNQVYPEFQADLEKTAFWAILRS